MGRSLAARIGLLALIVVGGVSAGAEVALAQTKPSPAAATARPVRVKLPARWAKRLARGAVHLVGTTAVGDESTAPGKLGTNLELMTGDEDRLSVKVDDCHGAIAWLRARAPALELRAGGHRVEAGMGRVVGDGRVLIDVAGELCDSPFEYHTDGRAVGLSVVSMVGPLLTVSRFHSEWLAGGPPYHGEQWRVFDVRSGGPVDLLDVVEEGALVAALQADPYVARRYPAAARARLAAATTFAEAVAALVADGDHHGFTASGFAAYDPQTGRADVRLGFTADGCGMCPNEVKALGLRVPVRSRWRAAFEAARRGDGRLSGRATLDVP